MSKKAPKSQAKELAYEIRDVVLAKVRGFPPWPGMIVDPESVPKNVAKERPNAKTKKGVWYCVRFFPAGDYAWIVPKDISKLQQHEIQAYINEPFKRSGDLLMGYRIALDPEKWLAERDAARAAALEEEANAEVDQLESDGEEGPEEDEEKKSKAKKRKRESDAAAPKSKAKAKAKKDSAEPPAKKKAAAAAKGKKNGAKSKTMVESEDEGAAEHEEEDAGPSKKASPPPAKKQKREKDDEEVDPTLNSDPEALKVRDWRHKLQKAFLNAKNPPKDEDMPQLAELFTAVETYEGMNIQYLSFSKIGKVMRHIYALPTDRVPRDDEFKFRDRAKVLVDKWHDILNANKPTTTTTTTNGEAAAASKPAPATNGAAAGATAHAEDAGEAAVNGKEQQQQPAAQAGAEGEGSGMDVDAKGEDTGSGASAGGAEADAHAEEEAEGENDALGDVTADESMLGDITMSEAAA